MRAMISFIVDSSFLKCVYYQ